MAVMGRLQAPRSEAYLRHYHWFNVASGDVGLQQAQVGVESFTERRIRKADVPAQWVIFSAIEQEEEISTVEDQEINHAFGSTGRAGIGLEQPRAGWQTLGGQWYRQGRPRRSGDDRKVLGRDRLAEFPPADLG